MIINTHGISILFYLLGILLLINQIRCLSSSTIIGDRPKAFFTIHVHGIFGNGGHFDLLRASTAEALNQWPVKRNQDIFYSTTSTTNQFLRTIHGVRKLGQRFSQEFKNKFEYEFLPLFNVNYKYDIYVTVVSFSLGGLISRYAIGDLFSDSKYRVNNGDPFHEEMMKKYSTLINSIELFSFFSLSSPHLGVRKRSWSLEQISLHPVIGNFVGQTGKDLLDMRESGVLYQLADPTQSYMNALAKFRFKTLVGYAEDNIVRYTTSLLAVSKRGNSFVDLNDDPWWRRAQCWKEERLHLISYSGFGHDGRKPSFYDTALEQQYEEKVFTDKYLFKNPNTNFKEDFNAKEDAYLARITSNSAMILNEDGTLEVSREMYMNLRAIPFRRITLDMGCRNNYFYCNQLVHKRIVGQKASITAEAERQLKKITSFYAELLMKDFETCYNQ